MMRRTYNGFFLATSLLLLGAHDGHAQMRAKDIKAIVDTEHAFNKMSVDSGSQAAFNRYLAPDAWLFRPRAVRAVDAARRSPLPADLVLTWEPEFADVSRAGDMGYTTGPWVSGSRHSDVNPKFGQFVAIWRRQPNGRYLGVFNAGIATPPQQGSPAKLRSPATAAPYIAKGPADHKATLLNADNNFANIAQQRGYAEALKPVAHPDIRLLRNAAFPALGMDSIGSTLKGARVTMWVPVEAVVASSGDMGYTRGSYVVILPGKPAEGGDYVRIWRRDKDGTWRIVLDMTSPGR